MRRIAWLFVLCLLVLAACNSNQPELQMANVRIGTDLAGSLAAQGALTPQGAPTDPTTGETGVTEAELTVFRGGTQVYFDAGGNEVAAGESLPIILTDASSSRVLKLLYGTYDFHVTARDSVPNVLATGSVEGFVVDNEEVDVTVPLVSIIDSASLSAPMMVMPNQLFDVYLSVHPPGRTDLILPTTDFYAGYSVTGGLTQGSSDIGIRVWAECSEVVIDASVYDLSGFEVTDAQRVVPVDFTCPTVDGTIGVDLIPPFVEITAPATGSTAEVGGDWVVIAGNVADAQTDVVSVELYDGVVSLGLGTITPPTEPGEYSTFAFESHFWAQEARTYNLTVVATDGAGNERQASITVTGVDP